LAHCILKKEHIKEDDTRKNKRERNKEDNKKKKHGKIKTKFEEKKDSGHLNCYTECRN
jgi:hypothetical protein